VGIGLRKKPKDLSASERDERGHGKSVGVYATLPVHPPPAKKTLRSVTCASLDL
jgi:hypothetical protein